MQDLNNIASKCGYCSRKIGLNHKFVNCALCKSKIHIKCNNIEAIVFSKMDKDKEVSMCNKCNKENFPFFPDEKPRESESYNFNKEFLASENLKMFFKGLNDFNNQEINNAVNSDEDFDLIPIIDCKYVDLNAFNTFKEDNKNFSIIHLNIASLEKHKDELENVLSMLSFKIDIIGISETKIKKGIDPNFNVEVKGYKQYSTPTESDKGGVIIYIANHYNCKPREDLDVIVYKSYVLESVFAEIIISNKKNILLGCIYRHPSMDVKDFNENYLFPLMDKSSDKNMFSYQEILTSTL